MTARSLETPMQRYEAACGVATRVVLELGYADTPERARSMAVVALGGDDDLLRMCAEVAELDASLASKCRRDPSLRQRMACWQREAAQ